MRGKGSVLTYSVPEYGITPAYAGKSSRSQNSRLERRDHPRLCGEKTIPLLCRRSTEGSPPPMRGKVDSMYEVGFQSRITPAYAGKSFTSLLSSTVPEDHPRLCGEKAA